MVAFHTQCRASTVANATPMPPFKQQLAEIEVQPIIVTCDLQVVVTNTC
jgi:hypothetical protein